MRGACLWRALTRGRKRRLVLPSTIQRTTSQIGLVNEDNLFMPLIPLDVPIPPEGFTVDVPQSWNGEAPVVLWENLGTERSRSRPDGTPNTLIAVLGIWDAIKPPAPSERWWALRLTLLPDFTLRVSATSDEGALADFKLRETSRGLQ